MSTLTLDHPTTTATATADLDHFFLGRLATLATRQAAAVSPSERLALAHAAFGIMLDCVDLGLTDEAQSLLDQRHDAPLPPARSAA